MLKKPYLLATHINFDFCREICTPSSPFKYWRSQNQTYPKIQTPKIQFTLNFIWNVQVKTNSIKLTYSKLQSFSSMANGGIAKAKTMSKIKTEKLCTWSKPITWTIIDVVVFGLIVKTQMLSKVLFTIISYSLSTFPGPPRKFYTSLNGMSQINHSYRLIVHIKPNIHWKDYAFLSYEVASPKLQLDAIHWAYKLWKMLVSCELTGFKQDYLPPIKC
jgi:hypothetical protein